MKSVRIKNLGEMGTQDNYFGLDVDDAADMIECTLCIAFEFNIDIDIHTRRMVLIRQKPIS